MLRHSSNDTLRGVAWANLFARAHPIADTGTLLLAHATHQNTCVGALAPVTTVFDLDGLDRFVDHPMADSGSGTPPLVDMGPYESRFADCDHSGTISLGDYAGFGIF